MDVAVRPMDLDRVVYEGVTSSHIGAANERTASDSQTLYFGFGARMVLEQV